MKCTNLLAKAQRVSARMSLHKLAEQSMTYVENIAAEVSIKQGPEQSGRGRLLIKDQILPKSREASSRDPFLTSDQVWCRQVSRN